jgi:hypothetical protein
LVELIELEHHAGALAVEVQAVVEKRGGLT